VHGIDLVGYVYVLEQLGVRFLRLGRNSAGAINAMLMAAAGPVATPKTDWLLAQLSAVDLQSFVDGDEDARDFIRTVLEKGGLLRYVWTGAQVLDNLREDLGLNPGIVLHEWLRALLDERGIRSLADLQRRRTLTVADGLRYRDGTPYAPAEPLRVAVVAADVTTESKVVFPEMADLYYIDPATVHPADFVRASLSIPGFYWPYRIEDLPRAGEPGGADWLARTGYGGPVPASVLLADGGILSNFPIDLFHRHFRVPACPTFGIKLGPDRTVPNHIEKFTHLVADVFSAARHGHDNDFITHNPDYRHLVSYADTSRFNWLDFNLDEPTKLALFVAGAEAAARFVAAFDWASYKEVRRQLIRAYQAADGASAGA